MRKANINDVKMEIWLRERGDRELRWVTKDGREIPIRDMSIDHLKNILNRECDYDRSQQDELSVDGERKNG